MARSPRVEAVSLEAGCESLDSRSRYIREQIRLSSQLPYIDINGAKLAHVALSRPAGGTPRLWLQSCFLLRFANRPYMRSGERLFGSY